MRRFLIATLAFILSSIGGTALLLLIAIVFGRVQMALAERSHSGIGAVAGGISEMTVLFVPILCGIIGVLITLHRMDHAKPRT